MPSNKPFLIESNGMYLKEFPMNSYNYLGRKIVFSGGGFFRALPYFIIKSMIKKSNYVMTYLHPRDFDNLQPFKELNFFRHIKSRIGTKNAKNKLDSMVKDFNFIDINKASKMIDWSQTEIIKY